MKPDRPPIGISCAGSECTSGGEAIFIGSDPPTTTRLAVPGLPARAIGFQAVGGAWRLRTFSGVSVEGIDPRDDLPHGLSRITLRHAGRAVPVEVQVGERQSQPAPLLTPRASPDFPPRPAQDAATPQFPAEGVIVIGSAPDCNVVLKDATVEAHHARLSRIANGRWTIRRLDPGGLIWLDGKPIVLAGLGERSQLTFGGRSLLWPDDFVATTTDAPMTPSTKPAHTPVTVVPTSIDRSRGIPAAEFSRAVVGFPGMLRPHLGPLDQTIESGKLYAVVGPSGAGKSTFCRALLGEAQLRQGSIKIAGNPAQENLSPNSMQFSFVPQADILIPQLTVGDTLEFAARVRLAGNVSSRERAELATRVAQQLEIGHTRDQRVSSLSGGEKRRVSIAQELLTEPKLLLLDEPTSGLDEGLDRTFMRQMRDLSRADGQPGIVVVTHATQNLHEADGVIAIGSSRGKEDDPVSAVRYAGPPQQLLNGSGHADIADFMDSLRGTREKSHGKRVSQTDHRFVSRPSFTQLRALVWRDSRIDAVNRGRQVLTALVWSFPVAVLIGIINKNGLRVDGPGSNPLLLVSISLMVIISSLGPLNLPITATVSRLPVAHREQRWGVSIRLAILVRALRDSLKVILQMLLTAGFVALAAWLVTNGADQPTVTQLLWIAGILVANGLACYAMGLLIGTTSVDETSAGNKMMVVVAVLIVFAGVMFHLPDSWALDMVSRSVPTRVAIADIASVLDIRDTMPQESVPDGPKLDPFMDLSTRWYGWLVGQLVATYFLGVILAMASGHRTLRRFEALR